MANVCPFECDCELCSLREKVQLLDQKFEQQEEKVERLEGQVGKLQHTVKAFEKTFEQLGWDYERTKEIQPFYELLVYPEWKRSIDVRMDIAEEKVENAEKKVEKAEKKA